MKVKIDIECTPEEARRFMGLPDMAEVHQAWVGKMQDAMQSGGAEEMFNLWSQMSQAGLQQWQNFIDSADTKPKK